MPDTITCEGCPWYERDCERASSYGAWYYEHNCWIEPFMTRRASSEDKTAPRACRHHPAYREQVEG